MKKIITLTLIFSLLIALFYKYIYSKGKLNNFLEKYPKSKYAQFIEYMLGEICFLLNKNDSAMFRFNRVIEKYEIKNYKLNSYYKIAQIYEQKQEMTSALKIYKEIAEKYPQEYIGEISKKRYEYLTLIGYKITD
ncbi:MAG: tetratricopeptide repeat protein [Endomicrobiia bacterium]